MSPRDLQIMEYLADALAAIRERLAHLEQDVAYLRRKVSRKPAAMSLSWLELLKLLPWAVALLLFLLGHMNLEELKAWVFGGRTSG